MTTDSQAISTTENLMRSQSELPPSTIDSPVRRSVNVVYTDGNVTWASFSVTKPVSVPSSRLDPEELQDIDDFVSELETSPAFRASIGRARQSFADSEIAQGKISPLARLRLAKGLSQVQLAQLAKTSQSHIARIESRKSDANPTLDTLTRIAEILGVKTGKLVTLITEE